jgi:hypothetical protein
MAKSASGQVNAINGYTGSVIGANLRWTMYMGNATAEGGGNAGSDFGILRFDNTGTLLGTPMSIARSTGVATFAQTIVNGSDARLKENVEPIIDALDKVKQLRGVSFNRIGNDPRNRDIGFIAQEVAPHSPESVQASASMTIGDALGRSGAESREGDDSPMLALDYGGMVALMAEAIKTLAARVEALEAAR